MTPKAKKTLFWILATCFLMLPFIRSLFPGSHIRLGWSLSTNLIIVAWIWWIQNHPTKVPRSLTYKLWLIMCPLFALVDYSTDNRRSLGEAALYGLIWGSGIYLSLWAEKHSKNWRFRRFNKGAKADQIPLDI